MGSFAKITDKWNVQLLPSRAYAVAYDTAQATVGFAFESQRGVHSFDSDKRTDFWTRPNSLAFLPKGCGVTSESDRGGEYLSFSVPYELQWSIERNDRFNSVISQRAIKAAYELRKLVLSGVEGNQLELEALLFTLCDEAEKVCCEDQQEALALRSMTTQRLKKLEEFIEDQLDVTFSVEDMAESLGLSAGFMNRAFKAATGQTPHEFVIERRLSRARTMLLSSSDNLSSIAYSCGFSSHAHMSTTFRKRLGLTPQQLRA